jgi:hypothetical protein
MNYRRLVHIRGAVVLDRHFCFGSIASFRTWIGHFRSTPINGHHQTAPLVRFVPQGDVFSYDTRLHPANVRVAISKLGAAKAVPQC